MTDDLDLNEAQPRSKRSMANARRRQIMPSHVVAGICSYSIDAQTTYHLATIFRLGDFGAKALVQLSSDRPRLIFKHMDCLPFIHRHNAIPHWFKDEFFDDACSKGEVGALEWAVSAGVEFTHSNGYHTANYYGHVVVLEWLRQSRLELTHTLVMDKACWRGHLHALQWWKDSGLPFTYSEAAMNHASQFGRADILQWWRDSGLELRYSDFALKAASARGHVGVLQWWKDSGLPLKYDARAIDLASSNGQTAVLQWWKDSGLELLYETSMRDASQSGNIPVLQWWKDSGLPLKYEHAMNTCRSVNTLQWWKDSGLDLEYTEKALETASRTECLNTSPGKRTGVPLLQWWRDSGLPLKVSVDGVLWGRYRQNQEVVDWWRASGLLNSLREEIPSLPRSQADKDWLLQVIADEENA
ncbi:hypothetical protein DFJ73DRAFT_657941 [Zopfochytrium polystomum]|nr:hypothetical protein DFJ73DRAFT_657941 [Zopfochytrium polystomum]